MILLLEGGEYASYGVSCEIFLGKMVHNYHHA